MKNFRPYCVSIAGFDPSGGAGLLADIKTFEQLKTQGLGVQTCNTIQTEDSFEDVIWTPVATILKQLEILLLRYNPRYFKIGIVENSEILLQILDLIHSKTDNPIIIWDPVLKPTFTVGGAFNSERFLEEIKLITTQITWVTPNIPEYNLLFGQNNFADNCNVYLKGGHSNALISENKNLLAIVKPIIGRDYILSAKQIQAINPKVKTCYTKHGTGCILSSALCAYEARRFKTVKASLRAKDYVTQRILSNKSLLAYHK